MGKHHEDDRGMTGLEGMQFSIIVIPKSDSISHLFVFDQGNLIFLKYSDTEIYSLKIF